MTENDVELYIKFQGSPILFIENMWGLVPQPIKKGYEKKVHDAISINDYDSIKVSWFVPFIKGDHITWQQWLILVAIEQSLKGLGKRRISIKSGHGIGKTADLAMIIIWYLFCHKDAQVPCTAPTSEQMHDILWKELAVWINKLPEEVKAKFDWTAGYLRITESPETWFARGKTARKEKPEALAGVHGEHVLFIVDEASGVPIEIFNTAEGALTGENIIVIMISNAVRLIGYFFDSFHSDRDAWQNLSFNSEDSPIVDRKYVDRIIKKHGKDSDEYRIRVKGDFPKEDAVDDKGYVPLLKKDQIKTTRNSAFVGRKKLGVDPAGEGADETSWVERDNFRAQVIMKQKTSNSKLIAQGTLSLMAIGDIKGHDTTVDNFGVGANVSREAALAGEYLDAVNVGDPAEDSERFINKRAEAYWRLREWLLKGGMIVYNEKLVEELLSIRFRRNLKGRIQIMPKEEMRKGGYKSPNRADALMLTFVEDDMEFIGETATNAPHTKTNTNPSDAI